MKIGLVGYSGFLGQAFVRTAPSNADLVFFDRQDDFMKLKECQVIINANGNSSKVLAEKDPVHDFTSNALFSLQLSIQANTNESLLIHISSGEVANINSRERIGEDLILSLASMNSYSLSKTVGESLVRKYSNRWMVIRPSGLIGKGMKKGPVFDLINKSPIWLHPSSTLSLMTTDSTARFVYNLMHDHLSRKKTNQVYNLMSKNPLTITEIAAILNLPIKTQVDSPIFHAQLGDQSNICSELIPSTRGELLEFLRMSRLW